MAKILPWLLVLFVSKSYSQSNDIFKPDSLKKEIEAVQITSVLHIDGMLNEPEWSLAKLQSGFVQIEPYQGLAPNFQTDIRVLYNRQFLYFGIFAHDSLGRKAIRATDFKRDFDYRQHDLISLAFDGFNDKRNAMSFVTDAYGVQRDLLSFRRSLL